MVLPMPLAILARRNDRYGGFGRTRPRRAADGDAITGVRRPAAGAEKGNVHDTAIQPVCCVRKSASDAAPSCKANPRALAKTGKRRDRRQSRAGF
jgi:hypothetical protein